MNTSILQLRLPNTLLKLLTTHAKGGKSAFVRQAILEKLDRLRTERRENQWIAKLQAQQPADTGADWLHADTWEDA